MRISDWSSDVCSSDLFRLHDGSLPGRPDIVLPKYRATVFVHGCFWHRHEGCRNATTPSTRYDFWASKFAGHVARDRASAERLSDLGWRVIVVRSEAPRVGKACVMTGRSRWWQ